MDPWTKPEHFDEEVKASANDDYQHVCDGSMPTPDLSQHASNQQLSQYDALAPSMYPAAPLEDHTCYDYDNCFLGREVQDSTRLEWSVATARQACMHRSGSSANVDLEECVQQHSRQGLRFIGGENYAVMLWTCLREAPGNSMSVQEMYQWVQDKTDKDHDALQLFAQGHNEAARKSRRGWQCSVRHNLSMNKVSRLDCIALQKHLTNSHRPSSRSPKVSGLLIQRITLASSLPHAIERTRPDHLMR